MFTKVGRTSLSTLLLAYAACQGGAFGDAPSGDAAGDQTISGDSAATGGDSASAADSDEQGDPSSAGDAVSSGDAAPTTQLSCTQKSATIIANTFNIINVSPGSPGNVLVGGNSTTLRQVISNAQSGDTILLADGTYTFHEAAPGSYTGLYFTTSDITLRSASGNAGAVILDSNYADHGESSGVISVDATGIVLADFTVKRSIFHLVHFWSGAGGALAHNLHLIDGGQQFIKASGGNPIDDVEISCSEFTMTAAGRDNVWGYGATDGGTRCYTGGIDTHNARSWRVGDNRFEGIYCNAAGAARPAHGKKGDLRNNLTYTGGLSEHAIHMWDAADGGGHLLERNHIINCARGIGLGMADDVYDTIIRNNMVFSEHDASGEHDVGINLERAHDCQVYNNTVFFSSASAYQNAIEYRWDSTSNVEIRNNLTNQRIHPRNNAVAITSNNVLNAQAGWFVSVATGDLHLDACGIATVDAMGMVLGSVTYDIDQDVRGGANDIGADQCL